MNSPPKHILPLLVISQFAGTSLWFTGNALLPELKASIGLSQYALSYVTAAVMTGFITGTLVFAFLSLADRYSPARLFFVCCIIGALLNVGIAWFATDAVSLFLLRFFTGFCIAGIYPVGMKIAADWYEKGLGKALGYLLGALVLGTSFPHLLRDRNLELPWRQVLFCTSLFAGIGGCLMLFFVGDGPHRKKTGGFKWNALQIVFKSLKWRKAAVGYFGHMWELYTFWGFLPLMIALYAERNNISPNVSLISFLAIASGFIGCVIGGYIALKIGSAPVAKIAIFISGLCCLVSPFLFDLSWPFFVVAIFIWGFTVIPDSPQFSTLVAAYSPPELRGTALTIYNSIGFTVTTLSLILMDFVFHSDGILGGKNAFIILLPGPIAGLIAMRRLK